MKTTNEEQTRLYDSLLNWGNNYLLAMLLSNLIYITYIHCLFTTVSCIGFFGIPGDYCRIRSPTCCPNRDDDCTMPILGNHLCYCDVFCDRVDSNDCCPDFKEVCLGELPLMPTDGKVSCLSQKHFY